MYHRTYHEARSAFREAATKIGAQLEQHKVLRGEDGDELTIDVAIFNSPNPKWTVITSSGLHGVEGFFGSAVQIAFLQKLVLDNAQPTEGQFVFLHALNPFGFAQIRRANENNVDLNRNFLLDSQTYDGAPEGYVQLSKFLNPAGPRWTSEVMKGSNYLYLGAEFGTYSVIRVLGALRRENQAYFYARNNAAVYKAAQAELLECFYPASSSWRESVLEQGMTIIKQAHKAASGLA